MNEVLQVKNLNYKALFKDLNLTIYENTINLITGSNNCGKTTFIKILSFMQDLDSNHLPLRRRTLYPTEVLRLI